MRRLFFCLVSILASVSLASGDEGWMSSSGRPAPDTAARKSVNGFGAWVIVTSDHDWRRKWDETPSNTAPVFQEAKKVRRGERVSVLTFFMNARPKQDHVDVTCDIDILRPNGTAEHVENAECYRGKLKSDPRYVFLSKPVIEFVGEPTDPVGQWTFRVTLRDNVRGVRVPVSTSFVLEN